MADDLAVLRQKLETLDGSRRLGNRGKAAVRIDDLSELLRLSDTLQAVRVSGSVTVADFNNLLEDVTMIHTRLLAIVAALRGRLGR